MSSNVHALERVKLLRTTSNRPDRAEVEAAFRTIIRWAGQRRMRFAEAGIAELQKVVDTLLIIPNQNLFRVGNEKTTITDAFAMADQVLYAGVACITDLIVKEGLINLDFADVRAVCLLYTSPSPRDS